MLSLEVLGVQNPRHTHRVDRDGHIVKAASRDHYSKNAGHSAAMVSQFKVPQRSIQSRSQSKAKQRTDIDDIPFQF